MHLTTVMKKQNTETKLINDPLLIEALKRNPFSVPEGYFSTLQDEIRFKKSISELGGSSFIVPKYYQDNLRQDILSNISEQKLKEQIPPTTPSVPVGYFNDLQSRILSKTLGNDNKNWSASATSNQDSIVEKPIRRLGLRKWLPYAAAASLMIVMGLFAILDGVKIPQNRQDIGYSAQIESISTDEIINYLANNTETGDLQYLSDQLEDRTGDIADDLSAQEIEAYLEYSL